MTNYNRIPTKSPWWHLSDEEVLALGYSAISILSVVVCFLLVIA